MITEDQITIQPILDNLISKKKEDEAWTMLHSLDLDTATYCYYNTIVNLIRSKLLSSIYTYAMLSKSIKKTFTSSAINLLRKKIMSNILIVGILVIAFFGGLMYSRIIPMVMVDFFFYVTFILLISVLYNIPRVTPIVSKLLLSVLTFLLNITRPLTMSWFLRRNKM